MDFSKFCRSFISQDKAFCNTHIQTCGRRRCCRLRKLPLPTRFSHVNSCLNTPIPPRESLSRHPDNASQAKVAQITAEDLNHIRTSDTGVYCVAFVLRYFNKHDRHNSRFRIESGNAQRRGGRVTAAACTQGFGNNFIEL